MLDLQRHYRVVTDVHERVSRIVALRLPWLIIGLVGGTVASILVSRYESVLLNNIGLAFFVPMIVYMSDAVGTQTETVYIRNLATIKVNFLKHLLKETATGFFLGVILGAAVGLVAKVWLGSTELAMSVGLAMFFNVLIAPVVAIVVSEFLYKEHTDPALGAGPFTTVIQDFISLAIYFAVATAIIGGSLT